LTPFAFQVILSFISLEQSMTFYVGWELPVSERTRLLELFPTVYERVIAHHVTLEWNVPADVQLPTETSGQVVGIADDHEGVQALVLRIGGTIRRPDGKTYHCTWSLATGRKPMESNEVIEVYGFEPLSDYLAVLLVPKLMRT